MNNVLTCVVVGRISSVLASARFIGAATAATRARERAAGRRWAGPDAAKWTHANTVLILHTIATNYVFKVWPRIGK